jgi:hypothetical protein
MKAKCLVDVIPVYIAGKLYDVLGYKDGCYQIYNDVNSSARGYHRQWKYLLGSSCTIYSFEDIWEIIDEAI